MKQSAEEPEPWGVAGTVVPAPCATRRRCTAAVVVFFCACFCAASTSRRLERALQGGAP